MSVKPTTIPLFDTNLTNASAPVGSKITDGYTHGAPLPSTDLNFQLGWLGSWAQYLSDQNFAGTITVNGLILAKLTKTLTSGNNNNVDLSSGAGSLNSVIYVKVTPDPAGSFLTGLAGGSLGRVLVLYNGGTVSFDVLHGSGSSLVANRFNFVNSTGITLPPRAFAVFVYGEDSLWELVSASSGIRTLTTSTIYHTNGSLVTTGLYILSAGETTDKMQEFRVASDEIIVGWHVNLLKGSSTGTMTAKLLTISLGVETILATQTNSASAPGAISLGETLGTVSYNTFGAPVYIRINGSGIIAPANERIYDGYVAVRSNC